MSPELAGLELETPTPIRAWPKARPNGDYGLLVALWVLRGLGWL